MAVPYLYQSYSLTFAHTLRLCVSISTVFLFLCDIWSNKYDISIAQCVHSDHLHLAWSVCNDVNGLFCIWNKTHKNSKTKIFEKWRKNLNFKLHFRNETIQTHVLYTLPYSSSDNLAIVELTMAHCVGRMNEVCSRSIIELSSDLSLQLLWPVAAMHCQRNEFDWRRFRPQCSNNSNSWNIEREESAY